MIVRSPWREDPVIAFDVIKYIYKLLLVPTVQVYRCSNFGAIKLIRNFFLKLFKQGWGVQSVNAVAFWL